jgi:hypothetical protein
MCILNWWDNSILKVHEEKISVSSSNFSQSFYACSSIKKSYNLGHGMSELFDIRNPR